MSRLNIATTLKSYTREISAAAKTGVEFCTRVVAGSAKTFFFTNNASAMNVIVDTNILRADFLFGSFKYRQFAAFLSRTTSKLVIPEVVMEEACSIYENLLLSKQAVISKAIKDYAHLSGAACTPQAVELFKTSDVGQDARLPRYHRLLENRLAKLQSGYYCHLQIIPYRNNYLPELIQRAINRIKPCDGNGEAFRDAVAWLSILDFVKANNYGKNVFITGNSRDFSGTEKELLDASLRKELEAEGLALEYFTSVEKFIEAHAIKTDWATKEWLLDTLDWHLLDTQLHGAVDDINEDNYLFLHKRAGLELASYDFYKVKSILISKEKTQFYFIKDGEGSELFLEFEGFTEISFVWGNEEEIIRTKFYIQTAASVQDGYSIKLSGEYYEEECGLALPEKNARQAVAVFKNPLQLALDETW